MPTARETTLGVALGIDGHSIREQLAAVARERIQLDVKQRLAAAATPRFWGRVGRSIEEAVASKLSALPVSTVVVDGWLKVNELRAYADPARHPPGEASDVALVKHSITSPHTVAVDLLVDGAKAATIEIDVEIELEIEGAILHVLDGKIRAITLGSVGASVRVEYAGKELASLPIHQIDVANDIELEHPIPISLPDRYATVVLPPGARVPGIAAPRP